MMSGMNTSKMSDDYLASYQKLRHIAASLKTQPSLSINQLEQMLKEASEAHQYCIRRIASVESLLPKK
jgi:hypothetical protein